MFTQQDYLDGKCTKEGFAITATGPNEAEPTPTANPEPQPQTETGNSPTPQIDVVVDEPGDTPPEPDSPEPVLEQKSEGV